MILKTKVFNIYRKHYKNLTELAAAMGIPVDRVYRAQCGKRRVTSKFVSGAIKAFPKLKFGDLFYLAPEPLKPRVWYDSKGDFIEVMFQRKEGYFQKTNSEHVMKKVDWGGYHRLLHSKG